MENAWRQFEDWVTRQGGRHTPERRLVFETVYSLPQLFAPSDVYALLQQDSGTLTLSRPTIYNTLEAFVRSGILARVHAQTGNMYIRVAGQKSIVLQECICCGRLQGIKPGGVTQAIKHLAFRSFTPARSITVVDGICDKCKSTQENNKT